VAFATTRLPAFYSPHRRVEAYRAPSASPQPWHARCPEFSELLRVLSACTLRMDTSSRRLPTVNVPVW
jgi:hypothetical protein